MAASCEILAQSVMPSDTCLWTLEGFGWAGGGGGGVCL